MTVQGASWVAEAEGAWGCFWLGASFIIFFFNTCPWCPSNLIWHQPFDLLGSGANNFSGLGGVWWPSCPQQPQRGWKLSSWIMAKGKVRGGRSQGRVGLFILEFWILLDKKTIPQVALQDSIPSKSGLEHELFQSFSWLFLPWPCLYHLSADNSC